MWWKPINSGEKIPMRHYFTAVLLLAGTILTASSELSVDRYGQYTGEEWPGKVTTDDQLRADAAKEWPQIRDAKFDPAKFDRFGGRLDAGKFEATGRFRLQKIDGRHWLITPEGHRYFLIGCDAVGYREGGYSTPLKNPDGSRRSGFAELPDIKLVPDGLPGGKKVNFLAANLAKKYGPSYYEKSKEVNRKRLISWGFNSTAKWGWGETFDLPYVEDWTFRTVKLLPRRRIDVYDPGFTAAAEKEVAALVARRKDDPMLIAYASENENGWEYRDVRELTAAAPTVASKQALVDFLIRRHGEAKAAAQFRLSGGRKAMLENRKIVNLNQKDISDFITESSRYYHRIVRGLFRKYDPDHLWFGASHCRGQADEWIYAAAEFTDAVMLNEYDIYALWTARLMPELRKQDKPFFITEFSFVCDQRGLRPYNSVNTVRDQQARGLGYRHYTEQLAADPLCIGFGYFIFFDQPVMMRSLPIGESFNFGLVDGTDRPYEEMIEEVKRSNSRLEAVHAGEIKPFRLKNPDKILFSRTQQKLLAGFLPSSCSPYIVQDTSHATEYFSGCKLRLKIDERRQEAQPQEQCPVGTAYAGDNSRFGSVKADCYVWKNHRGKDLNRYYALEGSQDGRHFSPLPLRFELVRQAEFDHYVMRNAEPIPAGIRYLRLVLKAPVPNQSWSSQIAGIEIER